MLKQLQYVRGAVGKSKIDASMSHFQIRDGEVRGSNGMLTICSPLPVDIECQPDAMQLIKALSNCRAAVELSMTPAGKLRLKSGSFKAFINSYADEIPHMEPEGDLAKVNGLAMLDAMKKLVMFVGDNAQHPWTNGIYFCDKSAYATNNVILAESWIGSVFPHGANVPLEAVREIIRINELPTKIMQSEHSMSFFYDDGRWLCTRLLSTDWPMESVRAMMQAECTSYAVTPQFWDAIEAVEPFKDEMNRVYFKDGAIRTSLLDDEGASVQFPNLPDGVFNIKMLQLLKESVDRIDFTRSPAGFKGDKLRGVIIGMTR